MAFKSFIPTMYHFAYFQLTLLSPRRLMTAVWWKYCLDTLHRVCTHSVQARRLTPSQHVFCLFFLSPLPLLLLTTFSLLSFCDRGVNSDFKPRSDITCCLWPLGNIERVEIHYEVSHYIENTVVNSH